MKGVGIQLMIDFRRALSNMMVMHVNVETLGQAEKIVYDVEHWPPVILPKSFVIHHISDAIFNFFKKKKAHGLVVKLCLII